MSDSTSPSSPWWKTERTRRAAWISAGLFLAGTAFWWFYYHPYVSTDDARVAATMAKVASQGSAVIIDKLNVVEGSLVRKGDVLLELDHRTMAALLEKARARHELVTLDLKRAELLSVQNIMATQDLEVARSNAAIALAEMKLAEVALDNTFLRSPVDGIVIQKAVEAGNILEPGQTAVTVADEAGAWIAANIEETEVGRVEVGQPVFIRVDEGGRLTGRVAEVRYAAAAQFALIPSDNAAGNFTKMVQRIPVKVALDPHPGRRLRVGQSVEIRIRVR